MAAGGRNPIKKIPVVVTGLEAEVHIDNIEPLAEAGDGGGALQANNNNHGSYQAYLPDGTPFTIVWFAQRYAGAT